MSGVGPIPAKTARVRSPKARLIHSQTTNDSDVQIMIWYSCFLCQAVADVEALRAGSEEANSKINYSIGALVETVPTSQPP